MPKLTPLRLLSTVFLLCVLLVLYLTTSILHGSRGYDLLENLPVLQPPTEDVSYGEACSPFAASVMDGVTIVLKMGASEVLTRLPTYLDRLGPCGQDILLFSDCESEYHGLRIHDALAHLSPRFRDKNQDFDVYDAIQRGEHGDQKTREGWRLDKYKFLPMMELTRHLRPESHWFVFAELDTYVNWDNMHRFLIRFDSKVPSYFGSPVWPRGKPVFAHGGTGFVLSSATMDELVARGKTFAGDKHVPGAHLFGKNMLEECCGDEVLASVLKASNIDMRGYWPMFNGEKPNTVRFGQEQWCEAILTLHHLDDSEFTDFKQWELSRQTPSNPLTFEELFTYIEPSIRERIDDWSNMSEDVTYLGDHIAREFVVVLQWYADYVDTASYSTAQPGKTMPVLIRPGNLALILQAQAKYAKAKRMLTLVPDLEESVHRVVILEMTCV